jgi:hypothetical protein
MDLGSASGSIVITFDGSGVQQAQQSLQSLQATGASTNAALSTLGKGLLGIGAAISAPLVGATKSAVDFQGQMANVNSILKLSDDGIAGLSQQVLDLSGNVAQGPTELASALYDINSAGFSGSQGLQILNSAALAANAGSTSCFRP